ncbi:GNAT family N-acetyltransferase [Criibacterium bergeronii]|uniref:GNAT family N-acetyltransferase n=1 Tax=Criibacterium bergeronii TaxID=1871336 RepID=A0A552VCJ3_9FIRM|nr:GNAT family N-acetyltransferase [Criibacterium bergeronii]TRW28195.1 GNAT family N-acetyltransferase [Criibacterium bergeronii]
MHIRLKEYELYDTPAMQEMIQSFCKQTNLQAYDKEIAIRKLNQGSPSYKAFICTLDKKVVGYILVEFTYPIYLDGMILLIREIFVKNEYRKKGIAKQMIKTVMNDYDKAISVGVLVNKENDIAMKLMQGMKFTRKNVELFEK